MSTPVPGLSERVVLVVDDDNLVCHVTARMLAAAGIRTLEAHDGTQALALLTELGPSVVGLVVSDVVMPRMTGEELAKAISEHWPTLPVLLVSALGDLATSYHAAFLAKPFHPDTLLALIAQLAPSFSTLS